MRLIKAGMTDSILPGSRYCKKDGFNGINPGKKAALKRRDSPAYSEIADLTLLIDIHVQERAVASQDECCLRPFLRVIP